MKKITVYGTGGRESVTRYRIWQYYDNIQGSEVLGHTKYSPYLSKHYSPIGQQRIYIKLLAWVNMCFRMFVFLLYDMYRSPDFIVVQRELVKKRTPWIINVLLRLNVSLGTKVIWDFDDHILAMGEINKKDFVTLAKLCTAITVTHSYLASLIPVDYKDKIILLPTTDGEMYELFEQNKESITKKRLDSLSKSVNVVWTATQGNLPYLLMVVPYLDAAAEKLHTKGVCMKLKVICDGLLQYTPQYLIIDNIKWTKENALAGLLDAHVGIMPLQDTDVARGKGAFKLVQYMSVGLPCISSNVGFNKDVIDNSFGVLAETKDEWIDAVMALSDKTNWKFRSEKAYMRWKDKFSYVDNLNKIQRIING